MKAFFSLIVLAISFPFFGQYTGFFQSNNLTFLPDGNGVQYQDSFEIIGLPPNAVFLDPVFLNSICLDIEHSYIGDLEVWIECPNGQIAPLINSFTPGFIPGGSSGGSIFLGHPVDINGDLTPGIPYQYCFSSNYNELGPIGQNYSNTIAVSSSLGPLYASGQSLNPTPIYQPDESFNSLIGCPLNGTWKIKVQDNLGLDDGYIFHWSVNIDPSLYSTVSGKIFNDLNENCIKDTLEGGIQGITVEVQPGNYVAQTNQTGMWFVDNLSPGDYTFTIDTTNTLWNPTCSTTGNFTVLNTNDFTSASDIGLINDFPCAQPDVSIYAPFLRRCLSNVLYVYASNDASATDNITNGYVDVTLDPLFSIDYASVAYQDLGNNVYRFQTGTIMPGQTLAFTINVTIHCDAELDQTLCMEANLGPVENCMLDTIMSQPPGGGLISGIPQLCTLPWDQSSLQVNGWCVGDSVVFEITNTGQFGGGDMECFSPVMVYVNGTLFMVDSIQIAGGQSVTYTFPGNGETWILQAEQHPLHPGNSHPNAHVEDCGSGGAPGNVNDMPLDDADPVVDIYCGPVTGSYDPNDKTGYPLGVTDDHFILPNQQLQYVVRFQNTGTDTAFTVVVRDTLDMNLNIMTVHPGVASHNYEFKLYDMRVLEWTFHNINLPDSNNSEPNSHGFLTFTVDQVPNLSPGSIIQNNADIYFDLNEPIITNQTLHTINVEHFATMDVPYIIPIDVRIYPNPANQTLNVQLSELNGIEEYIIYDNTGREIVKGSLHNIHTTIDMTSLKSGIYLFSVNNRSVKFNVQH